MAIFSYPLRVYIEDTDAGGIVYYVNYLKFMERARTEMMRSLSYDKNSIFADELMFVVHSVKADYIAPAKLDDALEVTANVLKVGAAYILFEQKVLLDGETLCCGEVKIVCVDRITMKPRALSKAMQQVLKNTISA